MLSGALSQLGPYLIHPERAADGSIRGGMFRERVTLPTIYGNLVPCYDASDGRKKYRNAVEFYPDGSLRSIYLQEAMEIETPIGKLAGELMTFYPNGALKRIFPSYGQISAYWSGQEEAERVAAVRYQAGGRTFDVRPECTAFYLSGALRSVTLWPQDTLTLQTPAGELITSVGVELREDGRLLGTEPSYGTVLETEYGRIHPSDPTARRMDAEHGSLRFGPAEEVESFRTVRDGILASSRIGRERIWIVPLFGNGKSAGTGTEPSDGQATAAGDGIEEGSGRNESLGGQHFETRMPMEVTFISSGLQVLRPGEPELVLPRGCYDLAFEQI